MSNSTRINPLGPNNSNKKYYSKDVPTGKHMLSLDWNPQGLSYNKNNDDKFLSHDNPMVNELFQNLKVSEQDYKDAREFYNNIIQEPLSQENLKLIINGNNSRLLKQWVFSNNQNNQKYQPIAYSEDNDTKVIINDIPRTGVKSLGLDITTNFLYLVRMFYSFKLDYKLKPIQSYHYTQGQLLFYEILLIENDPIIAYIILHKTIFSNKLMHLSVSSWLPSNEYLTYLKIQYIVYRFIKLYKPNYKHIDKIPQIIFNLGLKSLIYPIPGMYLLLHEHIYYGSIKKSYKILNFYYKYKAAAFFIITSVLIADFLNNDENDESIKDNPICEPECLDSLHPVCNQSIFAAMWAKNIGCPSTEKSILLKYKPTQLPFYNFEKLVHKINNKYRNINNFIMEIMQDFDNFYKGDNVFRDLIENYGIEIQTVLVNKHPSDIQRIPNIEKYLTFFKDIPTKDFKWVLIGGKSKRRRRTKKIKCKIKNNITKKSVYKDGWVILDYNPNKNKTRKNKK